MASEEGEPRLLGVIESFVAVRDQCPSGRARAMAEAALEAAKSGQPGGLRDQAYLVLSAIRGWRGDRASQVQRSLADFVADSQQPDS